MLARASDSVWASSLVRWRRARRLGRTATAAGRHRRARAGSARAPTGRSARPGRLGRRRRGARSTLLADRRRVAVAQVRQRPQLVDAVAPRRRRSRGRHAGDPILAQVRAVTVAGADPDGGGRMSDRTRVRVASEGRRRRAANGVVRAGALRRLGPTGSPTCPHDVVTTGGEAAVAVAGRLFPGDQARGRSELKVGRATSGSPACPTRCAWSRELRRAGLVAQPNHVFFAHELRVLLRAPPGADVGGGAGRARAHPVYAVARRTRRPCTRRRCTPARCTRPRCTPVRRVRRPRVYASPVYASPVYASAEQATGRRPSSARPAVEPWVSLAATARGGRGGLTAVPVVVLDTGSPMPAFHSAAVGALLPLLTADARRRRPARRRRRRSTSIRPLGTAPSSPASSSRWRREPPSPCGGSCTPRATATRCRSPRPSTRCPTAADRRRAAEPVLRRLRARRARAAGRRRGRGPGRGYVWWRRPATTAPAVPPSRRRCPASSRWAPSARTARAPFSNYGPWVRACAPGVDLVSTFFAGWNGDAPCDADGDPDDYTGWACWSGTSFAAPVVVGALAREMATGVDPPTEAVARLIDNPALLRIPGLGTVVNVLYAGVDEFFGAPTVPPVIFPATEEDTHHGHDHRQPVHRPRRRRRPRGRQLALPLLQRRDGRRRRPDPRRRRHALRPRHLRQLRRRLARP